MLLEQIDEGPLISNKAIELSTLGTNFKRSQYDYITKSMKNFLDSKAARSQWTIITGLRGVGKTTLLAQLYQHPQLASCAKFYLSLDSIQILKVTMADIQAVIENRLKTKLLNNKSPTFIFLDEIHFLPQWALATKVMFDNSQNLFLVCTGSSAISFWTNPDIGRRAKMISLAPFSFQEFLAIEGLYRDLVYQAEMEEYPRKLKTPVVNQELSQKLKQILFDSNSAQEVYDQLKQITPALDEIKPEYIDNYINFYGSLPYATEIKYQSKYYNDEYILEVIRPAEIPDIAPDKSKADHEIRERIIQTLNTLFLRDLDVIDEFDAKTKDKFFQLLLMLANSTDLSLRKIAKHLGLNISTVQNMLKALTAGEIIYPIPPAGFSRGKIAKPYKYYFSSPSLRSGLSSLKLHSKDISPDDAGSLRGRLLEETMAMYLKRIFVNQSSSGLIEYDAQLAGADFIVMPQGLRTKIIVIEVGYSKKTSEQVGHTLKRLKGDYGLVVTDKQLRLDAKHNSVFIPLSIFLML